MNEKLSETEKDLLWWKLWVSTSVEELIFKCSIYGIDVDKWLVNEGKLWHPRYEE